MSVESQLPNYFVFFLDLMITTLNVLLEKNLCAMRFILILN